MVDIDESIKHAKEVTGHLIEQVRRQKGLTQMELGSQIGFSAKRLREMEGGNPVVSLERHIACCVPLQIPISTVLIPIVLRLQGRRCPPDLLRGDIRSLEDEFVRSAVGQTRDRINRCLLG